MPSKDNWSPLPDGWVASPFAGTLPSTLYRYRQLSNEWVEKRLDYEVSDEAIFLAGADTLNDPDEGRVRWRAHGSFDVAFKVALNTLRVGNDKASPVDLIEEAALLHK